MTKRKLLMGLSAFVAVVVAAGASAISSGMFLVGGPTNAIVIGSSQRVCLDKSCSYYISRDGDSKCTATIASDAGTCNGLAGVLTDDGTDINNGTIRSAITVTNALVTASSVVVVGSCSALDSSDGASAALVYSVVPDAGSFALTVTNEGAVSQTSVPKYCFVVR